MSIFNAELSLCHRFIKASQLAKDSGLEIRCDTSGVLFDIRENAESIEFMETLSEVEAFLKGYKAGGGIK